MGTVLVGLILLLIVGAVVFAMVRGKKRGKPVNSCGGDCSHCGGCH
ncbi:MAG: FeoB-associated Cys-rich membrane protein [Clostridiales bacterium]|nr:FeoB-associated Cys-rich membrane protein [Clostridiales bacterium]